MKYVAHTFFICIVTLLFSCCDDSSNYVNSDWSLSANPQYLEVETPSDIVIPSRGGSHSVSFETSDNWSVVSNSSWVHLNSTSGTAGQHVLTIQAEDNPSVDERFDTTYIQGSNPNMRQFRIITKQAGRYFTASADNLTFESEGGTATIEIDTDDDWKVSSCPEWITLSQMQGKEKVSVSATVSEFPTETRREGTIVIESSVCGKQPFDVAQTCDNYQPWLSFTSDGAQTLRFTYEVPTLEYSVNGGEWEELGTKEVAFGGELGELRLRGKSSYGTTKSDYPWNIADYDSIQFSTNNKVTCTGDIRTIVDYSYYNNIDCKNVMFSGLFKGCPQLVAAPQLPATTLASYCYANMFEGCSSLTTAPVLPATTLASNCYANMFEGCSSLTTAPVLPATTLAGSCYSRMFWDCSSLTAAPVLPATTLAGGCYSFMFGGCSSLKTAPQLPATTLVGSCYLDMFEGCSSLTTAPQLPAMYLAKYCYTSMFEGCSSLTTAPVLPATTLAEWCYMGMFRRCSSLITTPQLPATTLTEGCYTSMFEGCSSLTTAPVLPATTLAKSCYLGMFQRCSSLTTAPQLPATTLALGCYSLMFQGCSSLMTAPVLPATTLAESCYLGMFVGCSSLTTAPQLPATTLALECYRSMFQGCSSLMTAPVLPATTLADDCYRFMFYSCRKLCYIEMMATDISAKNCLENWLYKVSAQGTFVKNSNATWDENGVIPNGWTVVTK